jgi:DNA-binding LacI/PurR family transcriptional regulator
MVATIYEVARRAGVSIATVSRVFSRPEVVADATRLRVHAAAEELGYRPSAAARAMARGGAGSLGVLVHDLADPFQAAIVKGVQRETRRAGLPLLCAEYGEQPADELTVLRGMARQADGLLLYSMRTPDNPELINAVDGLCPTILIDNPAPGVPAVLMSTADGLAQAVDHLQALGHHAVVHLAGAPTRAYPIRDRRRAVEAGCRRRDLGLTVLGPFQPTFESGVRAADLVIAGAATAVIAFNDEMALGVIRRLTERGVRVGSDVSVIGVGDTGFAHQVTPALTTVRLPCLEAGATAVRLLLDLLAGKQDTANERITLSTELIVRSSTGVAATTRV